MKFYNSKICVVLPSKNEGKGIKEVIYEILNIFQVNGYKKPTIIVTDDSNDETRNYIKSTGAIIVNGGGKGLGFAMYQGLKHSLKFNPDLILSCDSDGQIDLKEIPKFIKEIENNNADLVLGSRFLKSGLIEYKYRWINRLGTIILSKILRSFTGLKLTDSHGGLRCMRPEVIQELEMLGTHTYVQETIIDAYEKGFRIIEIPSIWKKREIGKSKVVGSIPTYIFYTLPILIIRSKQHIKWLYSIGIILFSIAVIYFSFISWQAAFDFKSMFSRLPSFILIALLVLVGIQLFFFGFILQIIKDIKYRIDRIDKNWK